MLNDKRVAAAVIAEAKHGTLKYSQHGDRLDLIGDGWALMIYQDYAKNKLRKTLGAIVEMLGEIPAKCCIDIYKTKDGYAMQEGDPEAFGSELAFLSSCSRPEEIRGTTVSIGGVRLLQTFEGRIVGTAGPVLGMAALADDPPMVSENSDRVKWVEQYWELSAKAFRPEGGPNDSWVGAIWDALEQLELVDWPVKHRPAAEQMKMEDPDES